MTFVYRHIRYSLLFRCVVVVVVVVRVGADLFSSGTYWHPKYYLSGAIFRYIKSVRLDTGITIHGLRTDDRFWFPSQFTLNTTGTIFQYRLPVPVRSRSTWYGYLYSDVKGIIRKLTWWHMISTIAACVKWRARLCITVLLCQNTRQKHVSGVQTYFCNKSAFQNPSYDIKYSYIVY